MSSVCSSPLSLLTPRLSFPHAARLFGETQEPTFDVSVSASRGALIKRSQHQGVKKQQSRYFCTPPTHSSATQLITFLPSGPSGEVLRERQLIYSTAKVCGWLMIMAAKEMPFERQNSINDTFILEQKAAIEYGCSFSPLRVSSNKNNRA